MEDKKLSLYTLKTCPFCHKVMRVIDKYNLDVEIKPIEDEKNRQELIELGGKEQVPMLLIGDEVLYESSDIVKWLKTNLVNEG